jgi:hypothetical protein
MGTPPGGPVTESFRVRDTTETETSYARERPDLSGNPAFLT